MREVTIEIPDDINEETAREVATDAVQRVVVAGLVESALAKTTRAPEPGVVAQAALRESRWREVEERWGMLDAVRIAVLTGNRVEAARDAAANLRRRKGLTGIKRHGSMRYPGFQFYDSGGVLAVAPAWTRLKELLTPARWADADVLAWAAAPNAWLEGRSPADEIQDQPLRVTAALKTAIHEATAPASGAA